MPHFYIHKLLRNIFLFVALYDSGPSYEPTPIQAPRQGEIEGASLILLVSNVGCIYLNRGEINVWLLFSFVFVPFVRHQHQRAHSTFYIHHPPATTTYTCLYFVDTALFSLKHFSSIVFCSCWNRFLHLFAALCKRCTKTTLS